MATAQVLPKATLCSIGGSDLYKGNIKIAGEADPYPVQKLAFTVPFDYGSEKDGSFIVTCKFLFPKEKGEKINSLESLKNERPDKVMAYLIGGPGSPNVPATPKLINRYHKKGYVIMYMDYRGTGESQEWHKSKNDVVVPYYDRVEAGDMGKTDWAKTRNLGNAEEIDKENYLLHILQDNIVRDLEAVRLALGGIIGNEFKYHLVGQSYGGFVAYCYLSLHSEGLETVVTTGGIPPIGKPAEEVYEKTLNTVMMESMDFFQDNERNRKLLVILGYIISKGNKIPMPPVKGVDDVGYLSAKRFLHLGRSLGSTGGREILDALLNECCESIINKGGLTEDILHKINNMFRLEERKFYAILADLIYAPAGRKAGSPMPSDAVAKSEEFKQHYWWLNENELVNYVESGTGDKQLCLVGEHFFEYHYEEFASLRPFKQTVKNLLLRQDLPEFYDIDKIANSGVPTLSITYAKDHYINVDLAKETFDKIRTACKNKENFYMEIYIDENLMHTAIKDMTGEIVDIIDEILPVLVAKAGRQI